LPAAPSISAGGATTFCSGGNVVLTSSASSGNQWFRDGSAITGATNPTYTAASSGSYTVTFNNGTCTSAASAPASVTVNPLPAAPSISAGGATTFCSGGSVTLTSSYATGNLWSTGATTQSITVSTSGSYTVRVTDGNGCQSAASTPASVTVNPMPDVPTFGSFMQATCSTPNGSFEITNYNASYSYSITPSVGVTIVDSKVTAPTGSYTLTATLGSCTSESSANAVINSVICANDDDFTTPTVSSGNSTPSVTANDTLDGKSFAIGNGAGKVTLTEITVPSGLTLNTSDGTIAVNANTPSGTYTVVYQICENGASPSNCDQASATVVVKNGIDAVADTIDPINGNIGGTTIALAGNDTLDGKPFAIGGNPGEVTISIVGALPSGLTLNAADGTIAVAPNTPKGNYSIEYRICEVGANPTNCDSVTITIPVTAGDLVANADAIGSVAGSNAPQTLGVNVLDNDTKNGVKLDPADVTLTESTPDPKGYLVLNPDGTVTLGANPPAGDYELTYTICEKLNPDNCKSNTVRVTVDLPGIDAVADAIDPINGNIGGTTIALAGNDTLDGKPFAIGGNLGEVTISIIGTLPSGLTLNAADGTITVAPNTPKGDYSIEYRICDNTNSGNCDSVTITVPVTAGDLVANADAIGSVAGSNAPQTLGVNVLENDTKNGVKLDPADVTLTESTPDPKGYLVLNPDGTVTLGTNPPAGDYELTYTICEKLNPDNCKSNTVRVTVDLPGIDAVADTIDPINGNIGGTTIALAGNDTLDGKPFAIGGNPGEVTISIVGTLPSGLALNGNGTITVAPNTPKGDYSIEYRICDNINSGNCDSVTITVPVTAGDLVANADAIPSVAGSNAPQTLGVNVLDNDTKNGAKLDPADVTLTESTPDPKGYLVLNPDGTVTLGANPPAGDYELTYTICEKLNPDNCKSNTVRVTVDLPAIEAVADTIAPINGNIGGTTIALTGNDTLDGKPFAIGGNPGEVSINIVGTLPTGLTLNGDGTITVAPNTPKGDYAVEYRICENTNPSNCDSVTITVPVTAGDLVANADPIPSVIGSNAPQTLGVNVLDNDTKNGVKLDPADVTMTESTPDPKGYLVLNPDGTVTLGANPPAGTYELTYTICEKLNPGNCKSNTVTVTVGLPVIDAVIDSISSINGNTGATTLVLTANDTLNGKPVVIGTNPGEVSINIVGTLPTGLTLNGDGTITVAPNTPKGDYAVEYRICDNTNSGNCDSVTITIPVTAGDLVANADTIGSVAGSNAPQTLGVNVLDNDTKNGVKLDPADVTLTESTPDPKGYLVLNPDGTVTLGANPPAGTYELTYTICEKLNPGNCKSNTVTVTVGLPVIDAVIDSIPSINGNTGATTLVLTANDTLNGKPVVIGTNPGEVSINIVGTLPTGLTLNGDGTITVAPNTPKGDYAVEYRICDNTNSGNCDSVTITIPVTAGDLVANADTIGSVAGSNAPQTLGVNVLDNDTKNGVKLDPADVTMTESTPDPKGYLVLNPDGTVTLGANPPAGDYELTYTICEKLNPDNCKSNTVRVTVDLPGIDAVADTIDPINGNIGGTTIALAGNDTLDGKPFAIGGNPGEVTISIIGTLPSGFTLNGADGTIAVAPNTPKGDYSIEYRICDNNNPGNCDSVKITVPVTGGDLVANADSIPAVKGSNAPQTLGVNVLENDTKNGAKLDPADVTLTESTPDPKGYLVLNPDGTVTLGANPPAGDYELTYTICEKLNPGNCKSNTVKVTVGMPAIDAIAETLTPSINGSIGGTTTASVIDNDTLNGNPAVIGTLAGQVKLTSINVPTGLTLNADGTVTVAVNTPSGVYNIEYSICEISNPSNCDTAISKVAVNNGTLVANSDNIPSVKTSNTAQNLGVNIFTNDTKNGAPLNPSDVNLTVTPDPKGYLIVNPDGSVTLGANAPAGDYEVTYTICEKLNTGNCSSNTVRVTVESTIVANIDVVPSAVGINVPQSLINVFANDTKDGNALVPSDVILTVTVADPKGYLTLDANGNAILAPNAPAGNYELSYSICDKLNSSNCSSNVVTVTVAEPTMEVVANSYCSNNVPYVNYTVTPDNFTANNQLTIKWIDSANNVVATQTNLPLSGNVIWPGAVVDADGNGVDWPGWTLNNGQWTESADGFELTRNGVRIEFSVNPTVTIAVAYPLATPECNARPTFSIVANNDEYGPIDVKKGTALSVNIFDNDSVNGVKPNASDVILTTVVSNPNVTLNADGSISMAANTPNGIYEVTYQICDATNTSNCSAPAIVKITVVNSVNPTDPSVPNNITLVDDTNISVDGINGSIEFVNVLDNDLINGMPINPADVIVTPLTTDAYFEWNADGTVSVKPNTPGNTYTLTYQVCEKANPSNCSTAVLTVFVEVPAIAVVKTAVLNDENKDGFANAGETITYKFAVTNTGNVALVGITIEDLLPGVVVSGQAINLGVNESNETNFTAVYKITQEDINLGSVSNQATVKGSSLRGVVVEDKSDDSRNDGDNPTVIDLNGCVIEVLNAFSPNGDQKNARFYIRGLECYPDNTVEIYNRWGVLVFSIDQYNNNDRVFVGYSNGRSTVKQTEGLPVGTYFYILKYKDSANNPHEKSGYLYINK
ncbi:T9SS type B sorting domain-containing protein, partial [Flavobacterium ustbae]|uniref:T9SS type B sorting domain-containing protein n=1 Tax=Flavobacterium ustbae TaxID=2488790 RepID=UPI0019CF9D23